MEEAEGLRERQPQENEDQAGFHRAHEQTVKVSDRVPG